MLGLRIRKSKWENRGWRMQSCRDDGKGRKRWNGINGNLKGDGKRVLQKRYARRVLRNNKIERVVLRCRHWKFCGRNFSAMMVGNPRRVRKRNGKRILINKMNE